MFNKNFIILIIFIKLKANIKRFITYINNQIILHKIKILNYKKLNQKILKPVIIFINYLYLIIIIMKF